MSDGLARRFRAGLERLTAEGGLHAPLAASGADAPAPRGVFPKVQGDAGVLGLAVSGGGDSMAMLHLAVEAGLRVRAVTVDHGLRAEAAAEAAMVGRVAAGLGVPHETLSWRWDGTGNLQDAARRGRRRIIADWARRQGVAAVALGHTRDDVAETFLMRLARGAGLDGLSAMAGRWPEAGVVWLRPMLEISRQELREALRRRGVGWAEDPSNENPRFDRVKARRVLAALAPLGLEASRLAEVAGHLAQARQALETAVADIWQREVRDHGIALSLAPEALTNLTPEMQRRLAKALVLAVAPADYAPRGEALMRLLARIVAGADTVLAGCRFQHRGGRLWAFREARAVAGLVAGRGQVWDGRWRIEGPWPEGAEMRALGAGIGQCKGWRETGLPQAALMAAPALWQGETLIAAPHAGLGPNYSAISLFPAAALHHSELSH